MKRNTARRDCVNFFVFIVFYVIFEEFSGVLFFDTIKRENKSACRIHLILRMKGSEVLELFFHGFFQIYPPESDNKDM